MNIADIPDEAWITKSIETDMVEGGGAFTFGTERAYPVRQRVVGTIQGERPEIGRVRIIPSTDHDLRVTDVNAYVNEDGTLEPMPDTLERRSH
ncbi:hypothetical protein KZC52_16785 [Microbacterium sp. kSW2-24]|uniref:hypothetical protein n=1 Tax=Microbacterium galbinum TaxID=2851646 RepID=UPI001FFCA021|nr:hypothetical protein [Microbacterium galbinum]MCK2024586.1 hypothetical protein [Microbacterium galbinum]